MRKPTGTINGMSAEQQAALERWLFDDAPPLTYSEAVSRLMAEFQVKTTEWSLSQFYQRKVKERVMAKVMAEGMAGNPMWGAAGGNWAVFEALLELTGRAAFDIPANTRNLPLKDLGKLADLAATGLKVRNAEVRQELHAARVEIQERQAEARERGLALKEREVVLQETKYRDVIEREKQAAGEDKTPKVMTDEELKKMVRAANFM